MGWGEIMKLSVEAKVAASVAVGFVGLTVGVIEQGNNGDQSAGLSGNVPTNNPEVSTPMSQKRYDNLLTGRAYAEDNRHRTQWQIRE
jgi:hypothetical protein